MLVQPQLFERITIRVGVETLDSDLDTIPTTLVASGSPVRFMKHVRFVSKSTRYFTNKCAHDFGHGLHFFIGSQDQQMRKFLMHVRPNALRSFQ